MTNGSLQSTQISRRQKIFQGLTVGAVVSALLLVMLAGQVFTQLQLNLSDIFFIPTATSDSIVIVALDDQSAAAYGRVPGEWSRLVYAELIERLARGNARVIGFDLLFDLETANDESLAQAIRDARESEARTRTILAAAGVQDRVEMSDRLTLFDRGLNPQPVLGEASENLGYVNGFPDIDGVIRRQPSRIQIGDEPELAFSLAVYMAYLRVPTTALSQLIEIQGSTLQLSSERSLLVDNAGMWQQNYFGAPATSTASTFPVVSLFDVVNDAVNLSIFDDKIVLVGLINNTGSTDNYPVPSSATGQMMSGVEIHANAIESLIQGKLPRQQDTLIQTAIIVLFAFAASILYAQMRWYWMLIAAFVGVLIWVIVAFLYFSIRLEIINLFHSSLALLLPLIGNIGFSISGEVIRRQRTEFLLQSVMRVSNQRLALEKILPLIAEDIQRAINAPVGGIWLWNDERRNLELAHQSGTHSQVLGKLATISHDAHSSQQPIVQDRQLAVPVIWQQRTLGVLAVELPVKSRVGRSSLKLLSDLAEQVAPNLENAILYTEIQRQKNVLEAILAGSPAAILVLDEEQKIIRSNQALSAIFFQNGPTPEQLEFTQLLTEGGLEAEDQERLSQNFRQHKKFSETIVLHNRSYNLDAAPLPGTSRWIVILNDVTLLAELNNLKTRMIRMASHDLKNPLSLILGYSGLLLEDEKQELLDDTRLILTRINNAAELMQKIIQDILNLEQFRSGRRAVEEVNFAAVIQEALDAVHPELLARHQILQRELDNESPTVRGNHRSLVQVVLNLLSNAIKYTPEHGTITIRLRSMKEADQVRLEVADTGYGIPANAQEKIFTEFYRARTAATAHIGGTGLGLSLVKAVVDDHSGRIYFESTEGVGTTFYVELPTTEKTEETG
jgi:two-component system phosphate regulon sensor histidine kinase PhoR